VSKRKKRPPVCKRGAEPAYCELVIVADSPTTEIWLGNDHGHLIQRASGTLKASLLPGGYTVEFGLGSLPYPIRLKKASRYTQAELAADTVIYARPVSKRSPE
jgi:hypothetical protein